MDLRDPSENIKLASYKNIDVQYLPSLNDCFAWFAFGASQSCCLFSLFCHPLWISNADEQHLIKSEQSMLVNKVCCRYELVEITPRKLAAQIVFIQQ